MDAMRQKVQMLTATAVYDDVMREFDDDDDRPRNRRVVENLRFAETQHKRKRTVQTAYRSNFSDEIQSVCSRVVTDDYIQTVTLSHNRVPTICVWNKRQVDDIKAMCFSRTGGFVLSCDKTYNLGKLYVTVTTYRNVALQTSSSSSSVMPVFLGPVFLHGNSDESTFVDFWAKVAALFHKCDCRELTTGSDGEQALRNAMTFAFPQAKMVFCVRHLKTNLLQKVKKVTVNILTIMKLQL